MVASQFSRRHVGVEAGGAGPQAGRGGLAAGDFVGEDQLEELGVGQVAGLGQGEAFGQGVEAAAELDRPQQGLSSAVTAGAGAVMPRLLRPRGLLFGSPCGCGVFGGEVAGVAGETGRAAGPGAASAGRQRLVLGGPFDHPADQRAR